jgi:ArsR family transcriptional regulator, arsenate/arsenite/antimonite-responsive transcriptional repressor
MRATITTTPDVFRAFADATRLRILNLLLEGEVCVCDLCSILDEIQPKVSRHLAYLRRVGLVTVRTEGKWKYYSVAKHPKGLQRTLLSCVKSCLREMDELRDDLDRLRTTDGGDCCG